MKEKCIKCDKVIKRCKKDGVLIAGIELIGYAHHNSAYDMGKNYHTEELHFVCCDTCVKNHSKEPKTLKLRMQEVSKEMRN